MDIPLEIIRLDPPKKESNAYGLDTNTAKLEAWLEHFTEDTIFCDCDMLVRSDITDGFDGVANVGYTVRTKSGFPFNAGVIFARHTEYSQRFFEEWVRVNRLMHNDRKLRDTWSKVVPGINQPALAHMLEDGWVADQVAEEYNMCDLKRWRDGKMVHIKSDLRNTVFLKRRRALRDPLHRTLHEVFWTYLGIDPEEALWGKNLVRVQKARARGHVRKLRQEKNISL